MARAGGFFQDLAETNRLCGTKNDRAIEAWSFFL
jgi:hypothetical protein